MKNKVIFILIMLFMTSPVYAANLTVNGVAMNFYGINNNTYADGTIEVINGGTLNLVNSTGGNEFVVVNITCNNFTVDSTSTVNGTSRGYNGGAGGAAASDPGIGGFAGLAGSGAGAGGNGNNGAVASCGGFNDHCGGTGAGGAGFGGNGTKGGICNTIIGTLGGTNGTTYDTQNSKYIFAGSGGGGGGGGGEGVCGADTPGAGGRGGHGGAGILINATYINISGTINMNAGNDGSSGSAAVGCVGAGGGVGRSGGGGGEPACGTGCLGQAGAGGGGSGASGGAIMIVGYKVHVSGTLNVSGGTGGDGGPSWASAYDGCEGGGGGGGRIKIFYESRFWNGSSTTDIDGGGAGKDGAGTTCNDDSGFTGSFYLNSETLGFNILPQYYNNFTSVANGTSWNKTGNIGLQCNWSDDSSISMVFLETNKSNSTTYYNYTALNSSPTAFYYNLTDIYAQNFQYRWIGNDSDNEWNSTDWVTFYYPGWNMTDNIFSNSKIYLINGTDKSGVPINHTELTRVQDYNFTTEVAGRAYSAIPINVSWNGSSAITGDATNFTNINVSLTSVVSGWTGNITSLIIHQINSSGSSSGNITNTTMYKNNTIVVNESNGWIQDNNHTSVAGSSAFIEGQANYSNTDSIAYSNVYYDQDAYNSSLERSTWNCHFNNSRTGTLDFLANSNAETTNYPILCNKTNMVQINLESHNWTQDTGHTSEVSGISYIEGQANYSNKDNIYYKDVAYNATGYNSTLDRSGWNCHFNNSRTGTLTFDASSLNETTNYPILCNRTNNITLIANHTFVPDVSNGNATEWVINSTGSVDQQLYWYVLGNFSANNTDSIAYSNVYWNLSRIVPGAESYTGSNTTGYEDFSASTYKNLTNVSFRLLALNTTEINASTDASWQKDIVIYQHENSTYQNVFNLTINVTVNDSYSDYWLIDVTNSSWCIIGDQSVNPLCWKNSTSNENETQFSFNCTRDAGYCKWKVPSMSDHAYRVSSNSGTTVCGNSVCESGEDSLSCPADCESSTPPSGGGGGGGTVDCKKETQTCVKTEDCCGGLECKEGVCAIIEQVVEVVTCAEGDYGCVFADATAEFSQNWVVYLSSISLLVIMAVLWIFAGGKQ